MDSVFSNKFKIDDYLIFETDFWYVSLRPAQPTLGSLVISLKRTCGSLSGISSEEAQEMAVVFKRVEDLYEKSFTPDKLNYLALMMVDEHVHFHVIPRYGSEKSFNSKKYIDRNWPKPPEITATLDFSEVEMAQLRDFLKDHL